VNAISEQIQPNFYEVQRVEERRGEEKERRESSQYVALWENGRVQSVSSTMISQRGTALASLAET